MRKHEYGDLLEKRHVLLATTIAQNKINISNKGDTEGLKKGGLSRKKRRIACVCVPSRRRRRGDRLNKLIIQLKSLNS